MLECAISALDQPVGYRSGGPVGTCVTTQRCQRPLVLRQQREYIPSFEETISRGTARGREHARIDQARDRSVGRLKAHTRQRREVVDGDHRMGEQDRQRALRGAALS